MPHARPTAPTAPAALFGGILSCWTGHQAACWPICECHHQGAKDDSVDAVCMLRTADEDEPTCSSCAHGCSHLISRSTPGRIHLLRPDTSSHDISQQRPLLLITINAPMFELVATAIGLQHSKLININSGLITLTRRVLPHPRDLTASKQATQSEGQARTGRLCAGLSCTCWALTRSCSLGGCNVATTCRQVNIIAFLININAKANCCRAPQQGAQRASHRRASH